MIRFDFMFTANIMEDINVYLYLDLFHRVPVNPSVN